MVNHEQLQYEEAFRKAREAFADFVAPILEWKNNYEELKITATEEEIPVLKRGGRTNFPCLHFLSKQGEQCHLVFSPNQYCFFFKNDSQENADYQKLDFDDVIYIVDTLKIQIQENAKKNIKQVQKEKQQQMRDLF